MAEDGVLSLRWNNHSAFFLKQLSLLRDKETYTDLTLVCGGQFYRVHRLVVSSCSKYFQAILEHTPCHHPAVVLQDVPPRHLEALLSYMYLGQVSVPQDDLAGLIKVAECLAIKGLAVPDDATSLPQQESPTATQEEEPPHPKRPRLDRDDGSSVPSSQGNDDLENVRWRDRGSRESSPLQDISTFPAQEQQSMMEDTIVIKLEEAEERMKCEIDNYLGLRDSCVGLEGQQNGTSQGEECQATCSPALPGNGGSSSGILPQYPAQPQSLKEVVPQALPSVSGIDTDSSQGWGGGLDAFTPKQEALPPAHHTLLHQREASMSFRLPDRTRQDGTTAPSTLLPFPLFPCTALEDGGAEGAGRPWREWRCSFPECGYVTDRESWLRQHVRKHTGEKPFACPLCSFRSAQKGNVNVHIKRVHYGGVMPLAAPNLPAAPCAASPAVTTTTTAPTVSAAATTANPKVDFPWLMKGKYQGAECSKTQNGSCE